MSNYRLTAWRAGTTLQQAPTLNIQSNIIVIYLTKHANEQSDDTCTLTEVGYLSFDESNSSVPIFRHEAINADVMSWKLFEKRPVPLQNTNQTLIAVFLLVAPRSCFFLLKQCSFKWVSFKHRQRGRTRDSIEEQIASYQRFSHHKFLTHAWH